MRENAGAPAERQGVMDAASNEERTDPNMVILYDLAEKKADQFKSHLIEGAQAQGQTLHLLGLRLLDSSFRTNHGDEITPHDGRGHVLCPGYAVDERGRLHKLVGGRWHPQSNFSAEPPSATFVVRTS